VESGAKSNRDHKDFLDLYAEEYLRQKNSGTTINPDERVTFKDIVQQFITFYTAGMDTTGITTGMAL
jgi:cytochrome P450